MTSSSGPTLDRIARRVPVPEPAYERLLRRRDRKRRNQRIAAGSVGIAVFVAAIWIVTSVGSLDRMKTGVVPGGTSTGPAETGPVVTGPAVTGPAIDGDLIDLPPADAPPSSPERGEPVLGLSAEWYPISEGAVIHTFLYADGRLIWWREGAFPEGENTLHEQRLTPEGVELMRAEAISSGLLEGGRDTTMPGLVDPAELLLPYWGVISAWDGERSADVWFAGYEPSDVPEDTRATADQARALERLLARVIDPASWLPAAAWADQDVRVYVPSHYEVCYGPLTPMSPGFGSPLDVRREPLLEGLPGPVQELLGATEASAGWSHETGGPRRTRFYCSNLTADEAHRVIGGLDDAGMDRTGSRFTGLFSQATFGYAFPVQDPIGTAVLRLNPRLPDGAVVCIPCPW